MIETDTQERPRWIQRLKSIWARYLQIGAVLSIPGVIGFWVWFVTLWGLWGLFLGWIPAALLGWLILRFIWLPVLISALFLLIQELPSKGAVLAFKGILLAIVFTFIAAHYEKKYRKKS